MKSTYENFVLAMLALIAISLSSAGILVAGVAAGIKAGMWMFWYITLYGTFAAILMACVASIVFLISYYAESSRVEHKSSYAVDSKAGSAIYG